MKWIVGTVSVVLALFLASGTQAQSGEKTGPRFYAEFKPVVGAWAEYEATAKGEAPTKMRMAVVEKEGDDYWYETVVGEKQETRMISKMLVSGNPGEKKNVKRMIFKSGNDPALEMPVGMMPRSSQAIEPKGKTVDKGAETVTVPAGTFTCRHTQYQDGEVVVDSWVAKEVSPYGLVRSISDKSEMVLVGFGIGAKTLITETPQTFEMPKMPRGASKQPPKGSQSAKPQEEEEED